MDIIERDIHALIASGDGIKAREIAKKLNKDRSTVNHYLYNSPYMKDLCYRDENYEWYGLIRQSRPHVGLGDYSGYYGTVAEFLELTEDEWFEVMKNLFADLSDADVKFDDWEILFELRIKKSRYIRIYADVLVITENYVFSLEFKMNDKILEEEMSQAAKYSPYLEVLFGPQYEVIPVLVLTKAEDLYQYAELPGTTAELPVCSGDMLFNIFDEYLGFLEGE